ncbi:MAG: ketoisovalerate oxidoreductase [Lentisphaerae bacterium]|nr:ketoisovalerate oxidoreductase [Lentisphaerota bacterium]MCP4100274.1 ketoisovalerate oxidoreductase [Lentisphaerota bacterium]
MAEIVKHARPKGFFENFDRRPGAIHKNMHYCPGCGHGILHKIMAEAIADFGIQDDTVIISPVGCSVFAYYYFDCFGISVPHGRAPSVGTGLNRANPKNIVISYQGDGDLGAIGFNNFIQAANRGENLCVLFVNNAIYGMTGGQMAPTTLPGQKTVTSPGGRSVMNDGYPMKVAEMVSTLDAPVYVERAALSTTRNIMKARKAVRKAIKNTVDKKGFSMVEVLAGCPINLKLNGKEMNEFIDTQMARFFPLGCLKDEADQRDPVKRTEGEHDPERVREALYPVKVQKGVDDDFRNPSKIFEKERKIKVAGFGGQGVLSLGNMIATMGKLRNFNASWLPSYGPEMRGGTANCSVILSRKTVGSPIVDKDCNLLIVLNQPSMDAFLPILKKNGVLIYDSSTIDPPKVSKDKIVYAVKASDIAKRLGDLRYANSVILGALSVVMEDCFLEGEDKKDFDRTFEEAIMDCFSNKESVIQLNIESFYAGKQAVQRI